MPNRKEVMCVRAEWSTGSRRHTSHPRQRVHGAVPRLLQRGGGWAPRALQRQPPALPVCLSGRPGSPSADPPKLEPPPHAGRHPDIPQTSDSTWKIPAPACSPMTASS